MRCPSCSHANPEAARFCNACGAPLAPRCRTCGAENPPGARFCNGCGAPLAAHPAAGETRKVVTIVFADLIGSTSLHERLDPESVSRLMDRYYQTVRVPVEAHGGTVVQLLGDGVLCAFGVPQVREDDALRAVRAAIGIQRAFREFADEQSDVAQDLGLRVALNTGEVVVSDEHPAGIGDPLNVAARLQQEAHDGDVLVGEATQRVVADRVTLERFGVFALKGRAETVTAYRVVSLERPAGASTTPFVGRDEELRRLLAVYDTAVAERRARLAVILGSPGLGKSRLLAEIPRRLGEGTSVLAARCDPAGGATFAPLAEALRVCLRLDAAAAPDAVRAALGAVVTGDDAARIIDGIAALLAGMPASPEETFFVVRRLLAALAVAQPLVLAIDDLQWAEPLLLDLTEHLVQWGTGAPLLVLAAARPELRDTRSALATPGGLVAEVVTLGGLDGGAAMRLAASVIGADELPAAIAGRVLATSEGNPLFVGELVRMFVQDGVLKRDGDRWTTGVELAKLEMPPTIHALLAARIERLRPEERTVLERAAVIGRQFSRTALAHLLPPDQTDLDARLEALRRSELIEPDATWFLGEPSLRFHHGLTRDAAYRRVLKGTRAELHERVADWIERRVGAAVEHDETIGWHLEQAHQQVRDLGQIDAHGRALGERAARHLAAAGRRALGRDDLPPAAGLLGRALDRLDPADAARADLALDWCEALLAAGDVGPATKALDELGRFTAGSERLRAWHACFAGELAVLTDPQALHATVDALAAAAAELASAGDGAGEAKAHSVHALALARLGKVGACEAALDRALAAARRAHDRRRSNAVLANAPLAALWGPSPVTRASGRCLDVVRVLRITQGAPAVEAVALRCQAVLEALRGRGEAARRMIASSRCMIEELGITQQLLETDVFAGLIDLLEGDPAAAEHCLRGAYKGLRSHGLRIAAARAAAFLGRALLVQDRAAEAEALSHDSEALAGDDLQAAITWRGVRAEALARRGEHADAVGLAHAAVDIAAATDALLHHANAREALAAALRAAGRRDEADAEERRAIELWEAKGATVLVERARRALAHVRPADRAGEGRAALVPRVRRRRVVPNAATANAARMTAAMTAGDADALPALLADGMSYVEHPTGTTYDRQGALFGFRALLKARDPTFRIEPLATLGDSLALVRRLTSASGQPGRTFDVGAYESDNVGVFEVDEQGRYRLGEIFAADRLGDGVARLYERYAELLPAGSERIRAAATARSVAAMVGPFRDLDRWAAIFAPDIEFSDPRAVGLGTVHGAEAVLSGVRALRDLTEDFVIRTDDVLALQPGALVVRWTNFGTDRAGGAFERCLCQLFVFGIDGLLTRWEQFDGEHEDEALARFDELTAGPPPKPVRRRVRSNAATANAARVDAALAVRDLDAIATTIAAESAVVDHTAGATFDREGLLGTWRVLLKAENPTVAHEPLATLGDCLALVHASSAASGFAGGTFDVGAYEREEFALVEVDERGQRRRSEVFAPDRLGDAITRLYERYAELLPEGPGRERTAATARSVAAYVGALDLDRMASVMAPRVDYLDHRLVNLGSMRGSEAFREVLRTLFEAADELTNRADDVLAVCPDALLMSLINSGTQRAGGGAFERPFLALFVFGADGLVTRIEQFDVGHEAETLARFDELTAAPTPARLVRRLRPNAATAHAARLDAAIAARDADALATLFAEDAEILEHPTGVIYDREGMLFSLRTVLRAREPTFCNEPMATLGDSLALCRFSLSASGFPGGMVDVGAYEREEVVFSEIDAEGRLKRAEFFARDRLGDAVVRLYERYAELLPEGPARARAMATARSVAATAGAFDLGRYAASLAPGIEAVDHRTLGTWSARGADALLAHFRSLLALVEDATERADDVLALRPHARLVRWTNSGTDRASGGAYERPFLLLQLWGPDGLLERVEWFDADRDAEALARFDELTAERATKADITNAATQAIDHWAKAWEAHDWHRIAEVFAPEFRLADRRTLVHLEIDRQQHLESLRAMFEMTTCRFPSHVLATRGERLALARARFEGADRSTGPSEVEFVFVLEVNEHGERIAVVMFDPDDLDAAYSELDERYAAGEAAPHAVGWRESLRFWRALAARDWEQLTATFAPDFVVEDHRPLGLLASLSRDEYVASVRALLDLRPDATFRVAHVLAFEDRRMLVVGLWAGGEPEGTFETPVVNAVVSGPDGARRYHLYNVDQLDEAWACYHGLRPDPLRIPPNAATRARERTGAASTARDWPALRALVTDDFVFDDRTERAPVSGGVDLWIESMKQWTGPKTRYECQLLATCGEQLALERVALAGDGGGVRRDMDTLRLTEVDAAGRLRASIIFDVGERRVAGMEMLERYARSDAARCVPAAAFEGLRAVNAHDLDRLRAALPDDFVMDDHRRTGLGQLERDVYLASLAALFAQAPDVTTEILYTIAVAEHGILVLARNFGTLREGGEFESVYVRMTLYQDDRVFRVEMFEPEQLDAARARFEELSRLA